MALPSHLAGSQTAASSRLGHLAPQTSLKQHGLQSGSIFRPPQQQQPTDSVVLAAAAAVAPAAGVQEVQTRASTVPDVAQKSDFASWEGLEIVDLGGLDVTPERRAQLVKQVRAGGESGLFLVKNMGVSDEDVAALDRLAKEVFALPEEEKLKMQAQWVRGPGYLRKFSRSADMATDVFPGFREIFRILVYPEEAREGNFWPPAVPEIREVFTRYMEGMYRTANFLTELLAEGLGLPASYIADQFGELHSLGALVNTPPQKLKEGETAAPGLPMHTDPTLFNINVQAGVRGLQFFVAGQWRDMPLIPNSAIVNVADDFETISNGIYHSPYHRVLTGSKPRPSLITAVETRDECIMAPAAQLVDEDHPALYRPRAHGDRMTQLSTQSFDASNGHDRTKAYMFLDPEAHLDKSRNMYVVGGQDFINGVPIEHWGITLQD